MALIKTKEKGRERERGDDRDFSYSLSLSSILLFQPISVSVKAYFRRSVCGNCYDFAIPYIFMI
jgi:hypothetical protein